MTARQFWVLFWLVILAGVAGIGWYQMAHPCLERGEHRYFGIPAKGGHGTWVTREVCVRR